VSTRSHLASAITGNFGCGGTQIAVVCLLICQHSGDIPDIADEVPFAGTDLIRVWPDD